MNKIILRFFIILVISTAGMFYLASASETSANKIKLQEEEYGQSLLSETSNTEYIFFESLNRFFVFSISK